MNKKLLILLSLVFIGWINSFGQTITSFPYSEDFDGFTTCGTGCGTVCNLVGGTNVWTNDNGDNLDWLVDNNGTSSSSTGPTVDHTQSNSSGNYLYVEASCLGTGYPNMTAQLLSPAIDLTGTNQVQFDFWYHMLGISMGTMHVDVSTDGGITFTNDVIPSWTDNTDLWQLKNVNLAAFTGQTVIVRIRHITGSDFYSDAAIDDVHIYDLLTDDAGVTQFTNPNLPTCNFNDSVSLEIINHGTDTLFNTNIDWEWNGVLQTQVNWAGALAFGESETVFLGTVAYTNGDTLKAYTSLPNGVIEFPSGAGNDTLEINTNSGLNGNYTIGLSGDYLTFNDAISDLNLFGVCGPVIFNVEDGVYNEQIELIEVIGMNDFNTVTFKSLNDDPNLVTLLATGTSATDNFTLKMNGADNFIFESLTISNDGLTYGTVIQIEQSANNNTWVNNVVIGEPANSTTSTLKALVYSGEDLDSLNTFDNNLFENGSYSIYMYGDGASSLESKNKIINNTFSNFYYRGLHVFYQMDLKVSHNTFTPNETYTGAIYRIYLNYCNALQLSENKVYGMRYGYGMYMSNCDGSINANGNVYNNFVHVGDTASTSTSYGIYLSASSFINVANNSVNIESNGTSSRGVYVTGSGNVKVTNNIIANSGPGYGVYYVSGVSSSNNNIIYVPNGKLAYNGGDYLTLSDWYNATGFDQISDTINPLYYSNEDLHTCEDLTIDGGGMPLTYVLTDIDGETRDANNPDIGADEFLGMVNLSQIDDTFEKCNQDTITLGGWEPASSASYLWSTADTSATINVVSGGQYDVTITNACGQASPSMFVVNLPDAVASFTKIESFMTISLNNTSTGTIDSIYWDFGDGTSSTELNPTHLYADTGEYIVSLIVHGPCGSDTMTTVFNSSIVGLNEINPLTALKVYPNPNNGNFTIDLGAEYTSAKVTLTDLSGKQIQSVVINNSQFLNYSIIQPAGVYLLLVESEGYKAVKRLIIE